LIDSVQSAAELPQQQSYCFEAFRATAWEINDKP